MAIYGNIIMTRAGQSGGDTLITLSGSLVRFMSSASRPFVSTEVSIVPQQDLHGQDAPYPSGVGKNKLVPGFINAQVFDGGSAQSSPSRIANILNVGTPISETYISAGTYTFSCSGVGYCTAMIKDSGGNVLDSWASSWNALPFTFTSTQDGYFVVCCRKTDNTNLTASDYVGQLESGSSATSFAPYSNICPVSGWDEVKVWDEATYDPTAQPKTTIQLDDTVYGGALTINEDESGEVNVYGNEKISLKTQTFVKDNYGFDDLSFTVSGVSGILACESLPIRANQEDVRDYGGICTNAQDSRCVIRILGKTAAEAESMLHGIDNSVIFNLATPITIPLTTQQINTLVGENNVWSDTGDIEVTVYGSRIP